VSKSGLVERESSQVATQSQHMNLIQIAIEKGSDIAQLERLMDLQDRYLANVAKSEFNAAMSEFQGALPVIEKGGVVDYTTNKGRTYYQYAKIEDIAHAIKPALKSAGLSYRFTQRQDQANITVTCIVTHVGGHSESSELASTPDFSGGKDPLKAIASAITYLRRYTLTGILGIVVGGEDDDATLATESQQDSGLYPDEEFNKNFKAWSQMILDNKKTVDSLHAFLSTKGIQLTEDQCSRLKQVGN